MSTPSGPDRPPPFTGGQVVTVFRSRRRPGTGDVYDPLADSMLTAARASPGFVDFASFESADGDRVSLVTFASQETHDAWRDDPAHQVAQARGRDELYEWYSVQVSTCTTTSAWSRPDRDG